MMKKLAILSVALLTCVSASAKFTPSFGSTIKLGGSSNANAYMDAVIALYNDIFPCPTFVYKQGPLFTDDFVGRKDVYNGMLDASVSDFKAPSSETANLPDCFLQIPFILSSVSIIYNIPPTVTNASGFVYHLPADLVDGVLRLTASDLCQIYTSGVTVYWETYLAKPYNVSDSTLLLNTQMFRFARTDANGTNQAFTTYLHDCGNCSRVIANDPNPTNNPNTLFEFDAGASSSADMISGVATAGDSIGYIGTGSNLAAFPNLPLPAAFLLGGGLTDGFNLNHFVGPNFANVQAAQINNPNCTNLICQPSEDPNVTPGAIVTYPLVIAEYIDLFGPQVTEWFACNLSQFIQFLLMDGQKISVPGFVPMTQSCLSASRESLDSISAVICEPCIEPCIPCDSPAICTPNCPTCTTC